MSIIRSGDQFNLQTIPIYIGQKLIKAGIFLEQTRNQYAEKLMYFKEY